MDHLLLVDGHNLLFQMFYGMPNRIIGQNGNTCHGVVGFIGGLLKMIKMLEPTHLFVIFDGEKGTDKNTIDEAYKANRIDYTDVVEEENPFSQLPLIYQVLDYLKIPHLETDGYETDDLIASYVFKNKEQLITIASSDQDFLQLVNDLVGQFVYRGKMSVYYNPAEVMKRYTITPDLVVMYKCLLGDNSDNLKGVLGVGKITASILANKYRSLDNLYANLSELSPKLGENLLKAHSLVYRNQQLIKLNDVIALPYEFNELIIKEDLKNLKTMDILKTLQII